MQQTLLWVIIYEKVLLITNMVTDYVISLIQFCV